MSAAHLGVAWLLLAILATCLWVLGSAALQGHRRGRARVRRDRERRQP